MDTLFETFIPETSPSSHLKMLLDLKTAGQEFGKSLDI